jgi:hypothetical protein
MKKRKLNSKNPKYNKDLLKNEKPIKERKLIKEVKGAKIYGIFYL